MKQDVADRLPLGPGLTYQQAEAIYEHGKEAVVFALLKQAQMLAEKNNLPAAVAADPSTPSAQKPVFTKDNKESGKRRKRPGLKKGPVGARRGRPERIDRTVEHRADCCPDCGGPLKRCSRTRDRSIEDIPAEVRVETVRHTSFIGIGVRPAVKRSNRPVIPDRLLSGSACVRLAGRLYCLSICHVCQVRFQYDAFRCCFRVSPAATSIAITDCGFQEKATLRG